MSGTPEPSLVEIKRTASGVYEVYRCANEAEALAFLRRRDVPQEKYYVIVETPLRNLGRDLFGIFDEKSEAQIEFPAHTPLREPVSSRTNCARCGYVVLPLREIESPTSDVHTVQMFTSLDELMESGFGYRCTGCSSLACASCYHSTVGAIERDADGRLHLKCWVCGSPVKLLKSATA
jgi:hypothetical protein